MIPDPVLLIGGTPRSGTTLVRNMLDAHPDVALPGESYFVGDVLRRLAAEGALHDLPRAWELIASHPFFRAWHLDLATLREVVASDPPGSYGDLLRALFAAHARSRGKQHAADKTTDHAIMFELLAEMLPASRFVHVVRDPRDVAISLSLQHWTWAGLAEAATMWRNHVAAGHAAATSLGNRMLEVRYEDLVADPGAAMERVCAFAGLPFDEAVLGYDALPGGPTPHHHRRAREPLGLARTWRDEMDADDVATVELVAGTWLEAAGYEPSGRSPRRPRAAAAVLVYKSGCRVRNRISARAGDLLPPLPRRLPELRPAVPLDPARVVGAAAP